MISQDSFVGLLHDLGDADAPPVDGRLERIHHKIKMVRIRRTVTAAVAVIAIVVAGLAVASLRSTPPAVPTEMPKSWTTDDGVAYRLVTVVTLDTAHQNSVTVKVPASAPLTLKYRCNPPSSGSDQFPTSVLAGITVGAGQFTNQHVDPNDQELNCSTTPSLVDIDTAKLTRTGDSADLVIKGLANSVNGVTAVHPARWTIGIYTWVMPATLRTTSTLAPMPQIAGYRLAATRRAVWPQHEITFTIPPNTTWGTLTTCSDTFAGAKPNLRQSDLDNSVTRTVNGRPDNGTAGFGCGTGVGTDTIPGETPPAITTTTVTLTYRLDPIYDHRNGVIQVGIYYKIY